VACEWGSSSVPSHVECVITVRYAPANLGRAECFPHGLAFGVTLGRFAPLGFTACPSKPPLMPDNPLPCATDPRARQARPTAETDPGAISRYPERPLRP
jgi:hypothetical protein